MAPRKRKAPEKKRRSLLAVLLSSTALGLGHAGKALAGVAARNPRPVLIAVAFLAAFGSVAANALWYQPHRVSSAFFATRDPNHFNALPGLRPAPKLSGDVTTYRIEHSDDEPSAETAAALPEAGGADLKVASLPAADPVHGTSAHRPAAQPENVALAVAVQQALIRKGLYDGVPDGVIGPRTSAAILAFEASAGLPQSGEVSDALLRALSADGAGASPADAASLPARPTDEVAAAIAEANAPSRPVARPQTKPAHAGSGTAQPVVKVSSGGDDLAALIRADGATKPASAPHKPAPAVASSDALTDPAAIRQIQRGLLKMDYPDVATDGVAGDATRAAIRQFEKYYGLPVTGVPSARVLAKMQEIGAV